MLADSSQSAQWSLATYAPIAALVFLGICVLLYALLSKAWKQQTRIIAQMEDARGRAEGLAAELLTTKREIRAQKAQTGSVPRPTEAVPAMPVAGIASGAAGAAPSELHAQVERLSHELAQSRKAQRDAEEALRQAKEKAAAALPSPGVVLAPRALGLSSSTGPVPLPGAVSGSEEVAKLQTELRDLKRRHSDSIDALRRERENSISRDQYNKMAEQLEHAQHQLEARDQSSAEDNPLFIQLQNQLSATTAELEAAKASAAEHSALLEQHRAETAQLQEQNAAHSSSPDLSTELHLAQQALRDREETLAYVRQSLQQAEKKDQARTQHLVQLGSELQQLRQRSLSLGEQAQAFSHVQSTASQLEEQTRAKDQQIATLQAELLGMAALRSALSEKEASAASALQSAEAAQQQSQKQAAQLADAQRELEELKASFAGTDLDRLRKQLARAEAAQAEAESAARDRERDRFQAAQAMKKAQDALAEVQARADSYHTQLAERESSLTSLQAELQQLRESHVHQDQLSALQATLTSTQEETGRFGSELQDLRQNFSRQERSLTDLRSQHTTAMEEVETFRSKLAAADRAHTAASQEKKRLSAELAAAQAQAKRDSAELARLQTELQATTQAKQAWETTRARLEGDLHAAQGRNTNLRLQWVSAQEGLSELSQLRLGMNSLGSEHHHLRTQQQSAATELTTAQQLLQQRQAELAQLHSQHSQLQAELQTHQHQAQTQLTSLQSEQARLADELSATQQALTVSRKELESMVPKIQLTQAQATLAEKEKELALFTENKAKLLSDLNAAKGRYDALHNQYAELKKNIQDTTQLKAAYTAKEQEHSQLLGLHTALAASLLTKEQEHSSALEEVKAARAEAERAAASATALDRQIAALKEETQQTLASIQGSTITKDLHEKLREELEEREALLAELSAERLGMNEEREQLHSQLAQMKEQLQHLSTETEIAKDKLSAWERIRQDLVEDHSRQIAALEAERDTARQEAAQHAEERDQHRQGFTEEQNKLHGERHSWTQKVADLMASLASVRQNHDHLQSERSALVESEQTARQALAQQQEEVSRLAADRSSLMQELSALRRMNRDLTSGGSTTPPPPAAPTIALGLSHSSGGVAGGGWQAADTDIAALLQLKDGEYQAAVQEREQQITALRDAIAKTETARTDSETRLQDVESQLRMALSELEALQAALEHQIRHNAVTPTALPAAPMAAFLSDAAPPADSTQGVAARIPVLEEELRGARALAEQWRAQATAREAEAARLATERQHLEQSLAAAKEAAEKVARDMPKEAAQWQNRYKVLQAEHQRTNTGLEEASHRLEALERYILSVRSDVERVRTQRDRSLAELEETAQQFLQEDAPAPAKTPDSIPTTEPALKAPAQTLLDA